MGNPFPDGWSEPVRFLDLIDSDLIELRNLVTVGKLIVRSARARKESRGLHYTTDYPEHNDAHWLTPTINRSLSDRQKMRPQDSPTFRSEALTPSARK